MKNPMQPPRVMVVDDETAVAVTLRESLCALGYEVPAVAASQAEALRLAEQKRPDLILMDIALDTDMDGIEAADIIRTRFEIPIVYLSANDDDELVRRAQTTEPFGYLRKPCSSQELHTTIEIALHKHATEHVLRYRLQFEHLLSEMSTNFMHVSTSQLDAHITGGLEKIGTFLGVDRSFVFLRSEDQMFVSNTHEWCAAGIPSQRQHFQHVANADFAYFTEQLLRLEVVAVPRVEDLPSDSIPPAFADFFQDIRSFVLIPMIFNENLIGFWGMGAVRREASWDVEDVTLLKMVGHIIANAVMHKQKEDTLSRSEQLFRTLVENQGEGVGLFDTDELFVFANPAAEEFFGVPQGSLAGRSLSEFTTPDQFAHIRTEAVKRRQGLKGVYECEIIRPDGSTRWMLLSATSRFDAAGNFSGSFGVFRDITDRKHFEQALRESEKRYASVFQATSEAFLMIDEDGRIVDANPEACKLYGYNYEELTSLHLKDVMHPDYHHLLAQVTDKLHANLEFLMESVDRRKDGTLLHVEIKAAPCEIQGRTLLLSAIRDITQRKQAEDVLRGYHDRLEELVEERTLKFSQAVQKAERLNQQLRREIQEHARAEEELKAYRNHLEHLVEERTVEFKLANEQLALQIDERRRAESEAQAMTQQLHTIIETVGEGITLSDEGGYFEIFNSKMHAITGYTCEDANASGDFLTLLYPQQEEREKALVGIQEIRTMRLGCRDIETEIQARDGSVKTLLVSTSVVEYQGGDWFLSAYHDITERKRAENAQAIRLRYEAGVTACSRVLLEDGTVADIMIAAMQHLLVAADASRVYIFENIQDSRDGLSSRQMYEVCADGISAQVENQDLQHLPYAEFPLLHERLSAGQSYGGQINALPANDREILKRQGILSLLLLPIWVEGRWYGYIGFDDCVRARQWEDFDIRLLRAAADMLGTYLEHRQAQEDLQSAKDAALEAKRIADAANKAKSDFLANMSHELRTPLNAVLGYTQILRHDPELNERQRNAINVIHRSSEHLLLMINDILDLSKIEAHKMDLISTEFRLLDFLRNIADITNIRTTQQDFVFTANIQPDLPEYVRGDEKRLRQVLLNLLSNAAKFTEQGRITLNVRSVQELDDVDELEEMEEFQELHELHDFPTPRFTHPTTPPRKRPTTDIIRFQVEDTGIGIPEEHLADIFLPFHQVNRPLLHTEGTGLGLAISRRLVRMMGGWLRVSSTAGEGSVFWFDLPLPQAVHSEKVSPKTPMRERRVVGFNGPPQKILIVDDEELNRELLHDILSPLGFELAEAIDGVQALDQIAAFAPELILLDLVMTDMDGFQVIEQVRQRAEWQHINIVAVSASAFQHTRERSLRAGCAGFIAKPLRMKELLEKLHELLPIEWVYETPDGDDDDELTKHAAEANALPPPEILRTLQDLARRGHLRKILDYIAELERTTPEWRVFLENIRTFAKNFRMDPMCQFLERYLEEE